MNLAARTVELNRAGEKLVFDVDRDLYRVAYYYLERTRDASSGAWSTSEARITAKHRRLVDALTIVFGERDNCPHDPATVERYMRSTRWGRELP